MRLLKIISLWFFAGPCHNIPLSAQVLEGVITDDQNTKLTAELSFKEFTDTIKLMHPDTASGLDGLNPTFFFPAFLGFAW